MELTYRRAVARDLPVLHEIAMTTFENTYGRFNTAENMRLYFSQAMSEGEFARQLKDEHQPYWLIYAANRLVGYCKLDLVNTLVDDPQDDQCELERLYFLPEAQHRGFGTMAFQHICGWAVRHGYRSLWLVAYPKNKPALAFYRKMGFEQVGTTVFPLGHDMQQGIVHRLILSSDKKND